MAEPAMAASTCSQRPYCRAIRDLAALGNAGLKLLDAIEKGQAPAAAFVAEQTKEITRMERPAAEVNLAATRPVKVLLKGGKK